MLKMKNYMDSTAMVDRFSADGGGRPDTAN